MWTIKKCLHFYYFCIIVNIKHSIQQNIRNNRMWPLRSPVEETRLMERICLLPRRFKEKPQKQKKQKKNLRQCCSLRRSPGFKVKPQQEGFSVGLPSCCVAALPGSLCSRSAQWDPLQRLQLKSFEMQESMNGAFKAHLKSQPFSRSPCCPVPSRRVRPGMKRNERLDVGREIEWERRLTGCAIFANFLVWGLFILDFVCTEEVMQHLSLIFCRFVYMLITVCIMSSMECSVFVPIHHS